LSLRSSLACDERLVVCVSWGRRTSCAHEQGVRAHQHIRSSPPIHLESVGAEGASSFRSDSSCPLEHAACASHSVRCALRLLHPSHRAAQLSLSCCAAVAGLLRRCVAGLLRCCALGCFGTRVQMCIWPSRSLGRGSSVRSSGCLGLGTVAMWSVVTSLSRQPGTRLQPRDCWATTCRYLSSLQPWGYDLG